MRFREQRKLRFLAALAAARDNVVMETRRSIAERSLGELLQRAVAARAEGLVALRDREGLRHGAWVADGYVVGVYVAGRFDPLLELLWREGALDTRGRRNCVAQLPYRATRCGVLASEIAGVERARIVDALRLQVVARFAALLEIAEQQGFDAALERREVPAEERSVRMPLGSLLRRAMQAPRPRAVHDAEPDLARRRLRTLAKALHPDRHPELDPEARTRLTHALAEATAAYHGFS